LRKPKINIIQFALFNEILDTIVVARRVEALSVERGGRGFNLILKLCKRFIKIKRMFLRYKKPLKTAKPPFIFFNILSLAESFPIKDRY